MKVDITIQLILFVINLGMCIGALIWSRTASRLQTRARIQAEAADDLLKDCAPLFERLSRIRRARLQMRVTVPEFIDFNGKGREAFLRMNYKLMTERLATRMLADGLMKVELISEEKDPAGKTSLVIEMSAQVLLPETHTDLTGYERAINQ